MIRLLHMNDTIKPNSNRENKILEIINTNWPITRKSIQNRISTYQNVSKPTLIRDINKLIKDGLVNSSGSGPATTYSPINTNPLVKYFDIKKYFEIDPDKRTDAMKTFNFNVFEDLKNIFDKKIVNIDV